MDAAMLVLNGSASAVGVRSVPIATAMAALTERTSGTIRTPRFGLPGKEESTFFESPTPRDTIASAQAARSHSASGSKCPAGVDTGTIKTGTIKLARASGNGDNFENVC